MKKLLICFILILSNCSSLHNFYEDRMPYSASNPVIIDSSYHSCKSEAQREYQKNNNDFYSSDMTNFAEEKCEMLKTTSKGEVKSVSGYFLNLMSLPIKIVDQTSAVFMGHSAFDTRDRTSFIPGLIGLPLSVMLETFTTIFGYVNYSFLEDI